MAVDGAANPAAFLAASGGRAKEKLHAFLESRPAGADARELTGLLLDGVGSDPELGPRFITRLLGDDPNFVFDSSTKLWSLARAAPLRIPLDRAEFTVVDLETTGGRAGPGAIVEIGAYRMVGRRIGESFSSLVRPHGRLSRFITRLTSITNEMVADAPAIEEVLPRFREFMGSSVMVAHHAPFDFSFLDFEYRRLFGIGLLNPVLCTLQLARRFLPSVRRRRLDALADHFGLSTEGRHRGLGDARMAAELLSIFLDIAAKMGIRRLDRLLDLTGRGAAGRRIERHVTPEAIAALPRVPGVYLMHNRRGDILYVGKARSLRDRVASYFNSGAGAKRKTVELVSHVHEVETRITRSSLEAALVEARLIRELKPPYNRMLKRAAPAYFVKLDLMDPIPRIALSRRLTARRGVMYLGPFIGRRGIERSTRALSRILGLRTCTGRLEPEEAFSPCLYGQMGHCAAPCNLSVSGEEYSRRVGRAVAFLRGRSGPLTGELARARDRAARAMRFEEAGRLHRDLEALATLSHRIGRLSQVVTENNLIIVTGGTHDDRHPPVIRPEGGEASAIAPLEYAAAHVILSGRLALTRVLDSPEASRDIVRFVRENYEVYQARPIQRLELEPMGIVARWLRERSPDDGRLIYLRGPHLDRSTLLTDFLRSHR